MWRAFCAVGGLATPKGALYISGTLPELPKSTRPRVGFFMSGVRVEQILRFAGGQRVGIAGIAIPPISELKKLSL